MAAQAIHAPYRCLGYRLLPYPGPEEYGSRPAARTVSGQGQIGKPGENPLLEVFVEPLVLVVRFASHVVLQQGETQRLQ